MGDSGKPQSWLGLVPVLGERMAQRPGLDVAVTISLIHLRGYAGQPLGRPERRRYGLLAIAVAPHVQWYVREVLRMAEVTRGAVEAAIRGVEFDASKGGGGNPQPVALPVVDVIQQPAPSVFGVRRCV